MTSKEDLTERIRNKLSLPHVVLGLMLKGRKVGRKHIKASLEDIARAVKLLDGPEEKAEREDN